MQITRSSSTETATGPGEYFTGTVYIDTIAAPSEPSRLGAASVYFTPGARIAWHTHPLGQTIYVTEGVGLCQVAYRAKYRRYSASLVDHMVALRCDVPSWLGAHSPHRRLSLKSTGHFLRTATPVALLVSQILIYCNA